MLPLAPVTISSNVSQPASNWHNSRQVSIISATVASAPSEQSLSEVVSVSARPSAPSSFTIYSPANNSQDLPPTYVEATKSMQQPPTFSSSFQR